MTNQVSAGQRKPNLPPEEQVERAEPDHRPITLLDKWRFVMQAISDKRLTAGDLRCVVAIANCYNSSKGRAWPSYGYISRQTGLSRSAIARSVSKLHALDMIHKVSGGTGRANTYRPAFREPPAQTASLETGDTSVTHETGTKHETSLTDDTTPVSRTTPDPSHACDTIPLNPRSISVGDYRGIPADGGAARAGGALRPVGGAPADDGFEQFWANYPKREGRTLAKQAYCRVVADGIAPDTLIAKARQYAGAKAGVDAKWLKMPANWLKEECWLEDPQPPRPRGPKPDRTAKPKPHSSKGKMQEPTPTAERVVNKQQPVAKPANPVVEKAGSGQARTPTSQPRIGGEGAANFTARTRGPLSFADTAASAIVAEAPKPVAASPAPVRAVMRPLKAPWFEPGEKVRRDDFRYGRVILGSESLADNDGKVVIELADDYGEGLGPQVLVDPAELTLMRIWHPKHGLGTFLFEEKDGEVSVFFDDKDGSSHVTAMELSPCISFDPKSLADLHGKMVRHPKLGHGIIVGEEENGKLIVVFDKDGSPQVNPAERAPKLSVKDTLLQCAEGRMEIPVDMLFAMRDCFGLKRKEDMENERLAEMLASAGLDAKGAAAIKKQIWSVLELFC